MSFNLPLTAADIEHEIALAMGDAENPRRCAASQGVEATATLQQRQEGRCDEVRNVVRIATPTGCEAKHQMAVASEDQLQGLGVRPDPNKQLGIGRFFAHNVYSRAAVLALQAAGR